MLKPFSGEKILNPVEMGPKNGGFEENGGRNLSFWFRDPPKRHFLARNRVVMTYFASKSVHESQEPKK